MHEQTRGELVLSEQLGDLEQCKVRKEKALVFSVHFSSVERNETERPFTKTGSG